MYFYEIFAIINNGLVCLIEGNLMVIEKTLTSKVIKKEVKKEEISKNKPIKKTKKVNKNNEQKKEVWY